MTYSIFQHNLISWTANLIYYIFYHYEFDFIERYKSNSLDWPWYENPAQWNKLLWKSIALSQFNANVVLVIVYAPLAYFELLDEHTSEVKDLPTPLSLALTILFCMMCEDCTFYFSHRFLHWKAIYPYIHKVHH